METSKHNKFYEKYHNDPEFRRNFLEKKKKTKYTCCRCEKIISYCLKCDKCSGYICHKCANIKVVCKDCV